MNSDMLHWRDLAFLLCNVLFDLACQRVRRERFNIPSLPHDPPVRRSPYASSSLPFHKLRLRR